MASYVIKQKAKIERQKNDHFEVEFIIDTQLPFDSGFTFGLFTKSGKSLVLKSSPTKDTPNRKLTFSFIPSDTSNILDINNVWELQMKTTDNKYSTIGSGDFYLIPTNVINE